MSDRPTRYLRWIVAAVALIGWMVAGCEQDSDIGDPDVDAESMADIGPDSLPDISDTGPTDTGSPDTGSDTDTTSGDTDTGRDTLGDTGGDADTDGGLGPYPTSSTAEFWDSVDDLSVKLSCREYANPACDDDRTPPKPGRPAQSMCEQRLSRHAVLGNLSGRYAIEEAVSSGRQTYDEQAARACVNLLKKEATDATPCQHAWGDSETVFSLNARNPDNPCERVLRPNVDANGKCLMYEDCKAGHYCDEEALADQCGGRCVPLGKEGDACDLTSLECEGSLDCSDGTCQPNPPRVLGETCKWDAQCKDDLNCKERSGDGKRCRSPQGPGQTCEFGDCQSGHECVTDPANPGGSTDICVAADSKAAGEACTDPDICQPGLTCHNNTCQKIRTRGRAESCDLVLDFCDAGLVCRPTGNGGPHTCADFAAAGDPCVDGACQTGLYCKNGSSETGTCRTTVGEGGNCEPGACQGSLYCVGGTCITRSSAGARCDQKLCQKGVRCTYYDNNNVCGGITARCTL